MKGFLCRRSLVHFITLLVMWFNVLAPTLSHAVVNNKAQDDAYIVICTSTGTKLVQVDNTATQTEQGQQLHSDGSCLLCALHASLAAPPTAEFSPKFTQNLAQTHLQWLDESSSAGLKWSPGAARAPPNFL
jgi:hypothetical protein